MNFSTKAKNLSKLESLNLKKSIIPKFYNFKIIDLENDENRIVKIINSGLSKKISIRSSFFLEDNYKFSMAGQFEGLSNIHNSKKNIILGIKYLKRQYQTMTRSKKILNNSEIIFQNHVTNSKLSGVVTNRCIKDGTNYYVINYDDSSNLTNTVTSGNKSGGRVLNVFKDKLDCLRSSKFKKIILSVKEIEKKIGINKKLDIEFALDTNNKINLFQIRPISTTTNWKKLNNKKFFKNLVSNQNKFKKINSNNKKFGNKAIFGLMPDWNPAEMIGYQPNNLAFSLYKYLITDESWNIARFKMGYKKVKRPLMYKFTGKPFIDARLSFYSFIPNEINHRISKLLVNHWSKILINKPYLHDKIEFDIADGSFDALTKDKIKKNYNFLKKNEKKKYLRSLKNFTNDKIYYFKKIFKNLNDELIFLEKERIKLMQKFKNNKYGSLNKNILIILKKLKSNGIVPFSIYARYAFIAKKILNSLKTKNIISVSTYLKILGSVNSIASTYIKLNKKSENSSRDKKKFINHFYHLRSGTYDISIKRFKEKIDLYELDKLNDILALSKNNIKVPKKEVIKIDNFLKTYNFSFKADHLINFCILSIKLRENSKFIFTRTLSDILEMLKILGNNFKIKFEDLQKFKIFELLKLNKKIKNKKIETIKLTNRYFSIINQKSKLPFLITDKNDFFVASLLLTKPNFITNKILKSKVSEIKIKETNFNLKNKIVLIENADPGFDWIFSHKIKGVVTKFGGVNSHMSIRCEELNIPAVIGLGEENYEKIKNCSNVILNCKNEQLTGL